MDIDVSHLAWLARIKLTKEEERMLYKRIRAAMSIVNKLLEAKVDDVEPLYHPQEGTGYLRRDEHVLAETKSEKRAKILANVAKTEEGFVVAPRTVED